MWKMATRLVCVALLALVGTEVLAHSPVTFIENLKETQGSRIVSGWEAELGQFPHQISLRMVNSIGGVNACGGSVIHPEWGITAAHCPANRVTIVVRTGLINMTLPQLIFETTKYYNHPQYDNNSPFVQPHDIGLIEFGRRLVFDDFVKPIRLQSWADRNRNYDTERLVASGWGRTWTNGGAPENLNWVYLLGNTNDRCRMSYGAIVVDSTICASFYNVTSQSTCQGDSGGPLSVIDDDGVFSMVGIASFVSGLGCHVGMPAGFIRPGHYHQWFTNVTGLNFDWEYSNTTTPQPGNTTTTQPGTTTTEQPGNITTSQPGNNTTSQPETTITEQPGNITTAQPGYNTTSQPETTITEQPGNITTAQPGYNTTSQPEITITEQPGNITTAQPGNNTTAQPGTTEQPGNITTAQPGNSTTAQPDNTTTAQPGNATNPLPKPTVALHEDLPVPQRLSYSRNPIAEEKELSNTNMDWQKQMNDYYI